jgi:hypothetical protein
MNEMKRVGARCLSIAWAESGIPDWMGMKYSEHLLTSEHGSGAFDHNLSRIELERIWLGDLIPDEPEDQARGPLTVHEKKTADLEMTTLLRRVCTPMQTTELAVWKLISGRSHRSSRQRQASAAAGARPGPLTPQVRARRPLQAVVGRSVARENTRYLLRTAHGKAGTQAS